MPDSTMQSRFRSVYLSELHSCNVVSTSMESFFFFQAEDGIRDLVRSRGLGDVYKRQSQSRGVHLQTAS